MPRKLVGELRVKTLEDSGASAGADRGAGKAKVQDIAVEPIEGAGGTRALSHINQIAMEQAKNRPQG